MLGDTSYYYQYDKYTHHYETRGFIIATGLGVVIYMLIHNSGLISFYIISFS